MPLKASDINDLSLAELEKKLRDARQELLQLSLKKKTGQLEKSHVLKLLRRDIARLETFATKRRSVA